VKPYLAEPFTNNFNQVIQPGQKVVVVTKGYSGGINTYLGTYLGYREYKSYYSKNLKQQVVCEVESEVLGKWGPDGKKLRRFTPEHAAASYEKRMVKRITNIWLNMIYPAL